MNDFEKTLVQLDEFCYKKSIQYAVIGGIAVIAYGSFRTTQDIDITALCKLENLDKIHKDFIKQYSPIPDNSFDFFSKNFVLPVKDGTTNIKIDISAGLTKFDESVIQRSKRTKLGEAEFYICSLEDLLIYKLFAARYMDLADVQYLIKLNRNNFDMNYLKTTAEEFRELERDDIVENLNKFLIQ